MMFKKVGFLLLTCTVMLLSCHPSGGGNNIAKEGTSDRVMISDFDWERFEAEFFSRYPAAVSEEAHPHGEDLRYAVWDIISTLQLDFSKENSSDKVIDAFIQKLLDHSVILVP